VIPNSIDTNRFFTSPNTTNKKIILYFGTLIRKKGILDIPEVFNQVVENIPDATLLLVGGDAKDISTGNASTWELMQGLFSPQAMQQTTYLGKKPYAEMQTYIQEASVCIFPSYAEALPVSWLEAMAMGKAIVASNIGWANEMMEHDREALLCHPSQHNMFATHIIQLLQDEKKRNMLGKNARKRVVNQFDYSVIAKKNICFYSDTIQSYKNSK
jgi:glycosyltransferase involved in cell wall biosynthesis